MRSPRSFLSCGLVVLVLVLSACSSAQSTAQTGTTFCFNCHSETSPLGLKILWAESGYALSVHLDVDPRDLTALVDREGVA